MKLSPIQQYCLQKIGIQQWRTNSQPEQHYHYQVFYEVDDKHRDHNQALLSKILQALAWPHSLTQHTPLQGQVQLPKMISNGSHLWFGFEFALKLGLITKPQIQTVRFQDKDVIICPALEVIANDPTIKRKVWEHIKTLKTTR